MRLPPAREVRSGPGLPTVVGANSLVFPATVVRLPEEAVTYSIAVEEENENVALVASSDTTVQRVELSTGASEVAFRGHKAAVNDVVEVREGLAASCSLDRTVQVFNVRTGAALAALRGHRGPVYALAVDPQTGRLLSASGDGTIRLWDNANTSAVRTVVCHKPPKGVAPFELYDVEFLSYTGHGLHHAITASQNSRADVWDLTRTDNVPVLSVHRGVQGEVRCLKMLPDSSGQEFLTAGEDQVLRLWDARAGDEPAYEFRAHRDAIWGLATDGRRVTTTSVRGRAIFWDVRMRKIESQLLGHGPFRCVSVAPSKRTFHLGNFNGNVYSVWTAKIPPASLPEYDVPVSGEEPPCFALAREHMRRSKDPFLTEIPRPIGHRRPKCKAIGDCCTIS